MVAPRRCRGRGRREAALVVIASLTLAVACTPDETLRVSPDEGSISVRQGETGTFGVSFELPSRRNVGTVALPARVHVVGDGSDIPSSLGVAADPEAVTISDRGTSVSTTLTIDVPADVALGDHTATIRPSTEAKHLDAGSGVRLTVTVIQGEAPLVTITSPTSGGFFSGDMLTITADVSDAQNDFDSWEILLDGNSVKTGKASDAVTADADVSGFADGSQHTVEITATDTAGHTGRASAQFTIDRGAPEVAITQPADGQVFTGGGPLPIAGTVSDPQGNFDHFELKLDGQLLTSGTTPGDVSFDLDTTTVGDGEHTISLEATDRAGNHTIKDVTITIEQTTPEPTASPG